MEVQFYEASTRDAPITGKTSGNPSPFHSFFIESLERPNYGVNFLSPCFFILFAAKSH